MTKNTKKTIGFALLAAAAFFYFRKKTAVPSTTPEGPVVYTPGAPPVNIPTQPGDTVVDAGNLGIFGTKRVFI